MPDLFIGTDLISVPKLKTTLESTNGNKFKKRIFTDNEIEYCSNKANSAIHFAGRFAAKEAVTKAILSSDILDSINMKAIEIISGKNRKPEVILQIHNNSQFNCKISISHTDEYAVAFAILEIV